MPDWRKNRSPAYVNFQPFRPFNNGKNEGMQVPCLLTFTGRSEYLDILKKILWILPFLYLSNLFCNKKIIWRKNRPETMKFASRGLKRATNMPDWRKKRTKMTKKNGLKHLGKIWKRRGLWKSDEYAGLTKKPVTKKPDSTVWRSPKGREGVDHLYSFYEHLKTIFDSE